MVGILVAACFICAMISTAQVGTRDSSIVTAVQELPDGFMKLKVANRSEIPVTAIVAVGDRVLKGSQKTVHSVRFFDSALDIFGRPALRTGEDYSFQFFGPRPTAESISSRSVGVGAVLFRDGLTWGDTKWIAILLRRRRLAYDYDRQALDILMDARLHGMGGAEVLKRLRDRLEADRSQQRDAVGKQMAVLCFEDVELVVQDAIDRSKAATALSSAYRDRSLKVTDSAVQRLLSRIEALQEAISEPKARIRD